ncbi:protein of unknown function [Vibrio tapetis subsp. tapetis]|uniref:Uncharacterized protein n=1 Tax=Vibrio tapetis subsp. tapetis TaxID=1671868 RepID=A0A2N8ZJV6_9VIBR|nr:protein of unknown function [Vibrio tapetis subsp. tapetis]
MDYKYLPESARLLTFLKYALNQDMLQTPRLGRLRRTRRAVVPIEKGKPVLNFIDSEIVCV